MSTDLLLNETALQKAQEKAATEFADDAYDRELISTYLREAGFEAELVSKQVNDGVVAFDKPHQRLVSQWEAIPTDQVEEEE